MKEYPFEIISGKEKIILSAPHNVKHIREKSIRSREIKTGSMVRVLSKNIIHSEYVKIVKTVIMMLIGMKNANINNI